MSVADPGGGGGGATGTPPPPQKKKKKKKNWIDCDFYNPFYIRMLKNRAQIALESIKKPRASRALKWALDPCRKGLRISRS